MKSTDKNLPVVSQGKDEYADMSHQELVDLILKLKHNTGSESDFESPLFAEKHITTNFSDLLSKCAGMSDLESVYEYITLTLQSKLQNTIVLLVTIDEVSHKARLPKLAGLFDGSLHAISNIVQRNIFNTEYKLSKKQLAMMQTAKVCKLGNSLSSLVLNGITETLLSKVERLLGINEIHTIGLRSKLLP